MKKMMLLASVVALAAMMLAAAPAFADDNDGPGNACEHHGLGVPPFCRDEDEFDFNFPDVVFCDFNDDGNDDGDNCDFNNNDRDIFRNIGNVDVSPNIDISQDIDQDADSGDISQPASVTGGGDNSIQTVGVQPTANTGNAQNATGILQAAPIVAGLGGDTVINNEDDNNGFFDDGRFVRCDRDRDGHDDGDDDCFAFVNDDNDNGDNGRDVFRNIGNDELNITGPDFGDVDVDSDASIDLSPSQVINGGGEVNQAASASSTQQWILTPKGWLLV